MNSDKLIREQLIALISGGNAHMPFDQAVENFPVEAMNVEAPNIPYTPWRLLEHMRIAQWDILEFIRNPKYVSPPWPEGYWPPSGERADQERWEQTVQGFRSDLQALQQMVQDPATDLYGSLPHAEGYTILREILVAADHNSYHLGEFGLIRQALNAWR